jgi:hypothetical protein
MSAVLDNNNVQQRRNISTSEDGASPINMNAGSSQSQQQQQQQQQQVPFNLFNQNVASTVGAYV